MAINQNTPAAEPKKFWTPARILLTVAACALLSALGLSSCNSNEGTTSGPASASPSTATSKGPRTVNAPPPPPAGPVTLPGQVRDLEVKTLDGGALKLSDYADKVVVVNLWATWCGPCQNEMPELVKLNNDFKSRGLVVIGMATTYNEHKGIDFVKDFVRSKGINYQIVWDDGSLAAPLVQSVNGAGVIPQSFVIARDGRIVKHFQGFNPNSTPQLMRMAVEDALNNKSKA